MPRACDNGMASAGHSKRPMKKTLFTLAALAVAATAHSQVINEFVFNHTGSDTYEYVEVYGTPFADYSNLWIVEIEGDSGQTGLVDDGTFQLGMADASGFWWTGFQANVWENGTVTLLLVTDFTGTVTDDLDTDDDGVFDTTPWGSILDSVAVSDGDAGDLTYSPVTLNADFDGSTFTVGGASRIPNGVDTDSTTDWVRNDFEGEGLPGLSGTVDSTEALNTPNMENVAVPEPGTVALVAGGLILVAASRLRRRRS